ncbi:MAG: hypothetical protein AAF328_04520 [Planctomycetota bacterium]
MPRARMGLILLLLTSGIMAYAVRPDRKLAIVSGAAGLLVFIVMAVLS